MHRALPALLPPPPLSWPRRIVLVLLMPLWLPVLGVVMAYGILFAPDPTQTEPPRPDDDDELPDDYVPPFVPPPPSASPSPSQLRPVDPMTTALAEPAPTIIAGAVSASLPPAEQPGVDASCWPQSFPAG
jgi:hypothetical protein